MSTMGGMKGVFEGREKNEQVLCEKIAATFECGLPFPPFQSPNSDI
jgi:hypothetical protein